MPSFAPPPPDPETVKRKPQVRAILVEALKRADIPVYDSNLNSYQREYWQTIKIGDEDVIQVRVTKHSLGGRYLTLTLYPEGLANLIVTTRSDDEEANNALADAIRYINSSVGLLLPETSQLLTLRGLNDHQK